LIFDVLDLIYGTPLKANEIYGIMAVTYGQETDRQAYIDVNGVASPMFHGATTPHADRIWAVMEHGDTPGNGGQTEHNILTYMNKYGGSPKSASNETVLTSFVDSLTPSSFSVRIRSNQDNPNNAFSVAAIALLDEDGEVLGFAEYSEQDNAWNKFISLADCICGECPDLHETSYSIYVDAEYDSTNEEVTISWTPSEPAGEFEVFCAPYGDEENWTLLETLEDEYSFVHETGTTDFIMNYYKVVQTIDDETLIESDVCYVIWTPGGVCWTEHLRTWEINADEAVFAEVNQDNEHFQLSLEIQAAGIPDLHLTVTESSYSYAMSNDMMLGGIPELVYPENLAIGDITLKFEIAAAYLDNELDIYTDHEEFDGIKRINVFKWFDEVNMTLPIETQFDISANTLYADVDEFGSFCLIDMEMWFEFLDENGEEEEFHASTPMSEGVWELRDRPFSNPATLVSVAFGNDIFVAIGNSANPNESIITSSNGLNWKVQETQDGYGWQQVTYGNGRFVAAGVNILTDELVSKISVDGITWTLPQPINYEFNTSMTLSRNLYVTYENGIFIMLYTPVYYMELTYIFTSKNGVDWCLQYNSNSQLYSVAYGNGMFMAVGRGGRIIASLNGVDWHLLFNNIESSFFSNVNITSIVFGNGAFVAFTSVINNRRLILTSTNGSIWNIYEGVPLNPNISMIALTFGAGVFSIIGLDHTISESVFMVSPDGKNWDTAYNYRTWWASDVTYGNGMFVAVGRGGQLMTWSPTL
jgi:hypothetical protein